MHLTQAEYDQWVSKGVKPAADKTTSKPARVAIDLSDAINEDIEPEVVGDLGVASGAKTVADEDDATERYELPFPPSVNHYWRRVGNKTIISKEGREYRDAAVREISLREHDRMFPDEELDVSIMAVFPDNRRRDIDNLLKATLDAMSHAGVYLDDSQIKRLSIEHIGTHKPGRLYISISRVSVSYGRPVITLLDRSEITNHPCLATVIDLRQKHKPRNGGALCIQSQRSL
jgi:crossover junction endodeoxyribonuclease RusA